MYVYKDLCLVFCFSEYEHLDSVHFIVSPVFWFWKHIDCDSIIVHGWFFSVEWTQIHRKIKITMKIQYIYLNIL